MRRLAKTLAVTLLLLVLIVLSLAIAAVVTARRLEVEERVATSPKTGFYVDAGDCKMFVQRIGDPTAPALIFVPGTGGWSGIWTPFMQQAARLGYQAIAIDLPPFGYTLPPPSGDYSRKAQGERILKTLDALGLTKASFVAHSIGSAPLVDALIAHPERATKVILIAPALGLDGRQSDGTRSPLQVVFDLPGVGSSMAAVLANPAYTPRLIDSFVTEKDHVTPEWIALFRQPLVLQGYYQGVRQWLPQLLAPRGHDLSEDPANLSRLTFPVTLVWGTADRVTPLSQGQHLKQWLPNAKLVTLPGGHVPMVEEPEQLKILLDEALR